ncbi:MAG: FAD binding domain-containing protein, partial [Kiritimatiellae bacterium]|nr:FAD binding domain-containing protein [Kiritimatiellia bacterium]
MKTLEEIFCRQPETLNEALTLLSDEATRGVLLSGGTDLVVQWQAGAVPMPEQVIDLSAVPELKEISAQDGRICIGACVTHAAIRNHALTREALPALVAACASIGARQIQSRGTLGGNVANASPAGDASPALLVAD